MTAEISRNTPAISENTPGISRNAPEISQVWRETRARIRALTEGETDEIAKMATVSCELFQSFSHFDWVGFYRNVGAETLKIGPYQGGHGCLVIPFSKGVCGAAARTGETQVVDDVDAFPGHIACAASTRSEIVAPVRNADGRLIGVLDIDSDTPAAFDATDKAEVEAMLAEVFGYPPEIPSESPGQSSQSGEKSKSQMR